MDKLKEQLAPVQKQLFWILCGCILGVCLFSWWRATAALKEEQDRYKAEIEQKTQAVSSIQRPHPNDATIKGMDELIRDYGEDVANGWARLAAHQEKVLVWPAVFDPDFVKAVEPLRPPELKVTDNILQEISADHRRFARDRFAEALPLLAKTIGAKWKGTHQGGGGMGGMGMGMGMGMGGAGGMDFLRGGAGAAGAAGQMPGFDTLGEGAVQEVDDSVVHWEPGNQSELLSVHFDFTASDEAIPKTIQVLYAQEDLWVLQNIMDIIKATNGEATQRHEAAVKTIESVRLGRSAFGLAGQITGVSGGSGAGGMGSGMGAEMGMGMGMGGPMGMQGAGGAGMPSPEGGAGGSAGGMGADPATAGDSAGGAGGMAAAGGMGMGMGMGMGGLTSANPTDYRYVDQEYKPLTRVRLINAMKGQPQDPKDLLLAVAKRVPVRIRVKMDQRRLPALLANCGNSALPVEIKQVRINREGGSSSGMMGGMGGGMGGGMDESMRRGPGGAGGPTMMMDPGGDAEGAGGLGGFGVAGGTSGVRSKVADSSIDANEISVEVYGIVYIYNPVNREALGLPPVEPAAVTPVTTPTSTTPPATTTPAPNTGAEAGKSGTPLSAVN